jgi:hypothetical protein
MADEKKFSKWQIAGIIFLVIAFLSAILVIYEIQYAKYVYRDAHSNPKVTTPIIKGKVLDADTGKSINYAYIRAEWDFYLPMGWDFPDTANDFPSVYTIWATNSKKDGSFALPSKSKILKARTRYSRERAGGLRIVVASPGYELKKYAAYYRESTSAAGGFKVTSILIPSFNTEELNLGDVRLKKLVSEKKYFENTSDAQVGLDSRILNVTATYNAKGEPFLENPIQPLSSDYALVIVEYCNFLAKFPKYEHIRLVEIHLNGFLKNVKNQKRESQVVNDMENIIKNNPNMPGEKRISDLINTLIQR